MAYMVEHLPDKHKALSINPSNHKTKQGEQLYPDWENENLTSEKTNLGIP
jgi:hypothetical protein